LVYAKTNNGTICFYVDQVLTTDDDGLITTDYYVGSIDKSNKIPDGDIKDFLAYAITNNMSIAQESP
jgi:hypothetical protein